MVLHLGHLENTPSGISRFLDLPPLILGFLTKEVSVLVGNGGVTYFALGHCHNPATRPGRAGDPSDTTPPTFRGAWQTDSFIALLRNAIAWGMAG